jgi:hypothetical protein
MWNQKNLFGETLEIPAHLKDVCCESCYTAQEEKCVCQCHGAYHGLGNLNKQKAEIDPSYEKVLPEKEAKKFRKLYGNIESRKPLCLCGYDLSKEPIVYYVPHSDGWTVEGETQKVWLYVKCPKCGYDMAIWKMGVPRE